MAEYPRIDKGSLEYPAGLLDLEDPPGIYVSGNLAPATAVAVVGTRRCTRYGLDLARQFGTILTGSGWTTVSGLAHGIDAAAHQGALRMHGHAVGVLGCGIDVIYPQENRDLYRAVLEMGGALISEYPPGTPPDRWRFPARNRIIAAISAAVVVVEAGDRGGALITARLAAEIGRPVLAVPGDVDRQSSVGCNRLIRDGAYPVLGAEDLVEELSLLIGPPPIEPVRQDAPLIPVDGLAIDDLSTLWACTPREVLARIGRMELDGTVVRWGDRIMRA